MPKLTTILRNNSRRPQVLATIAALALGAGTMLAGKGEAVQATTDTAIQFKGIVNSFKLVDGVNFLYYVPPSRRLMVTDVVATAQDAADPLLIYLYTARSCGEGLRTKVFFRVPAGETVHIPLTTGIPFAESNFVCVYADQAALVTLNGYIY